MDIYRVHLYVKNARYWRDWFVQNLGFQPRSASTNHHTNTELVTSDRVRILISSPRNHISPVAKFLQQHPNGVAELDFAVDNLELIWERAINGGAQILQPIQHTNDIKWGKISGWGHLCHTLIEIKPRQNADVYPENNFFPHQSRLPNLRVNHSFNRIDHAVINVETGDLESALSWYEKTLGFQRQQKFQIATEYSGLSSQVLVYPGGTAQLPINEPTSANSQIQEFLDFNNGSGIQHIALSTPDISATVRHLRNQGVPLIEVPISYYQELRRRQVPMTANQLQEIAELQILADWQEHNPETLLLQTFTQPIFREPTLFLELICRHQKAQGFGEGNFQALFQAVEREQLKRNQVMIE